MTTGGPHAEEASNQPPNIPGCPRAQPDTRENFTDAGVDHSEHTNFGQFSPFLLSSNPCGAAINTPVEPKFLVKVPLNFPEKHGELYRSEKRAFNTENWLCRWVPLSWACQLHDFQSSGRTPLRAPEPSAVCAKNLLAWHASFYRLRKHKMTVSAGATKDGHFL